MADRSVDDARPDSEPRDEPLKAGTDAPPQPWSSAAEIRPDRTATDESPGDEPVEQVAAGDEKRRDREPAADVAVTDETGHSPGESTDRSDHGQEAGSVSEPG
jgi:hypothetical protein